MSTAPLACPIRPDPSLSLFWPPAMAAAIARWTPSLLLTLVARLDGHYRENVICLVMIDAEIRRDMMRPAPPILVVPDA